MKLVVNKERSIKVVRCISTAACNKFGLTHRREINKFVKLNWLAEPELSPLFNLLSLFSSGSSSLKVNKNFWIIFHPSQTELNHTKPNSSITNRTQPHQTKLIHTKPNSTTPNQTHPNQTKQSQTIPNPNWLGMHGKTISSSGLLLAILSTLVILQNRE